MKFKKINFGKWEGTISSNNSLFIKKFDNGVKIRKRGQSEIGLGVDEVFQILQFLRKFCKRNGFPIQLDSLDMTYVWQKFPETKEFIDKLLCDDVTYEEKEEIHKIYMAKQNIIKKLENEKN